VIGEATPMTTMTAVEREQGESLRAHRDGPAMIVEIVAA